MSPVATSGIEPEGEPSDPRSVDDTTCLDHNVLVRCGEVEVGREATVVPEAALAETGAALEHEPGGRRSIPPRRGRTAGGPGRHRARRRRTRRLDPARGV